MEETIQYLQIITNVIIILLFIGLVFLVVNLIKSVKKITSKFDEMSGHVKDIKVKLEPAIEKFQDLTENVNLVFSKVSENVDVLGTVVNKVKDTTESLLEFEDKIRRKIEPPVMETANTISAVSIGIKTFFDAYMKRKKRKDKFYDREIEELEELRDSIDDVNQELEDVNSRLTDLQE